MPDAFFGALAGAVSFEACSSVGRDETVLVALCSLAGDWPVLLSIDKRAS